MADTLDIGFLLHQQGDCLDADLVASGDKALSAHEDGQYRQAIMETGTFLEKLAKMVLKGWDLPCDPQWMLGTLIGKLRDSGRSPSDLLERLNEANTIRNRAAHERQLPLGATTKGDSLQVVNILALIVEWYAAEFGSPASTAPAPDLLPVFLSVGGSHRWDQEQFVHRLRAEMRGLGVDLRQLLGGEYSEDKPFQQIRTTMASCRACLVVGLERSHAYAVFERERSNKERVYQDQYIPTAWNQIEGTMASALGLPVLMLKDTRLHNEGVFEAQNHGHRIRDFELETECRGLSPSLTSFLEGWVKHVRQTAPPEGRP